MKQDLIINRLYSVIFRLSTVFSFPSSVFRLLSSASLYICREPSTNQLLFMQNKPNFQDTQMNVNLYITRYYENIANRTLGQNKPNSNPIKPNLRKAQMNVKSLAGKSGHTRLIADVKKACKMQGHEDNGGNGT